MKTVDRLIKSLFFKKKRARARTPTRRLKLDRFFFLRPRPLALLRDARFINLFYLTTKVIKISALSEQIAIMFFSRGWGGGGGKKNHKKRC